MPKLTLTAAGRAQQTLRSIRLDLGLTLQEAANRVGCSRVTLSEIERGIYGLSLHHAIVVAKVYKLPLESLALLLYPQSGDGTWHPPRKKPSGRPEVPGTKSRAHSAEGCTALANAPGGEPEHNFQLTVYRQVHPLFKKGT